jgi:hypothetical protein
LSLPLLAEFGFGNTTVTECLGSGLALLGEILEQLPGKPGAEAVKTLLIDE